MPGTPAKAASPPGVPKEFTAVSGDQSVKLNWRANPLLSYRLYWSTTPGTGVSGIHIDGVIPPFVHQSLTNGPRYNYVLSASNSSGENLPTGEVTAVPEGPTTVPEPPRGVIALAGDQAVTLRWDPVPHADYYNVYWSQTSDAGITGTQIANVRSPYGHLNLSNDTG